MIGRHCHFIVSPSGRQRRTVIAYDFSLYCHLPSTVCFLRLNAAKVMCSTIAVCVEAGGLAVSTKRWYACTTNDTEPSVIRGIPLSLTQRLVRRKRLYSRVVVATNRLSHPLIFGCYTSE